MNTKQANITQIKIKNYEKKTISNPENAKYNC